MKKREKLRFLATNQTNIRRGDSKIIVPKIQYLVELSYFYVHTPRNKRLLHVANPIHYEQCIRKIMAKVSSANRLLLSN